MILRLLKSNRTVNLILYPVIGAVLWLKSLINPFTWSWYPGENGNILFRPLYYLLVNQPFYSVLFAFTLLILMAVLMQQINDSYSFIRIRTKLPGSLFVIIVSGLPQLHTLHPVYPAALFLLLAIERLFDQFDKNKAYPGIFNTGLFIGIGSLFYFNLIFLFPAFLAGIIILCRDYKWREFVIMILGLALPFVFAFGYMITVDEATLFLQSIVDNLKVPVDYIRHDGNLHIFLSLIALLVAIGSVKILQQFDSKKVSTRKYFTIFLLLFISTVASALLIPSASIEMLVFASVPVTFLLSNFFVFIKSRFWGELLFLLFLGMVIFIQFEINLI